jgi:peptidoglycan/xylan/chitin deacetylase (PgdA/CDA1 family)
MNNKISVFFRNDDVRGTLDESLVEITNLFLKNQIPITYAVEPANISVKVINWLNELKAEHPNLIEIIQHGYDHKIKNMKTKGEFGGQRKFKEQYDDILKGRLLMDSYFQNGWEKIFTFPYGAYNKYTLLALENLKYIAISSSIDFRFKSRLKDYIGRKMGVNYLFGKKISYHSLIRPQTNIYEISTCVNLIMKYQNEMEAIHYPFDVLLSKIESAAHFTNLIGILLHHRFHYLQLELIERLILHLTSENYHFTSLSRVIKNER